MKERKNIIKKILCIETGEVFNSLSDAARHLGDVKRSKAIGCCCNRKAKTAFGFHWKKLDEEGISEKVLTEEEFFEKLMSIHPEYDYSMTKYKGTINGTKYIDYFCPIHRKNNHQLLSNFLKGCGCDECGTEKAHAARRMSFEEFKRRCIEKYGAEKEAEYIYSDYKTTNDYMQVKHLVCGNTYPQIAGNHLYAGNCCPYCYGHIKMTNDEFIEKSKEIFGEDAFDYSECEYNGLEHDVTLICKTCGLHFPKNANMHLSQQQGCPRCNKKYRMSEEEYIEKAKEIFPEYDYSNTHFKSYSYKVNVRCIKHNNKFDIWPLNLLRGHTGCVLCEKYTGEQTIAEYFIEHKIDFKLHEDYPEPIRDIRLLKSDFYIPSKKLYIEYNGIQHYEPIEFYGGIKEFEKRVYHDGLKKTVANLGYKLLVIPYWDLKKIKEILDCELNK